MPTAKEKSKEQWNKYLAKLPRHRQFIAHLVSLYSMWPYAMTFGMRYYWDAHYRKACKSRVSRTKYGSGYHSSKRKIIARLIIRSGQRCAHCFVWRVGEMTIDHILPKASGGTNALDNLQLLCVPCHNIKTHGEITHRQKKSDINIATLRRIREKKALAKKYEAHKAYAIKKKKRQEKAEALSNRVATSV